MASGGSASPRTRTLPFHIVEVWRKLIVTLAALLPSAGIAYIWSFTDSTLRIESALLYEITIAVSTLFGLAMAIVAYRNYQHSGEPFPRFLTLAFVSFSALYAIHGVLTRSATDHPLLFLIFGPASRLCMAAYLVTGFARLTTPSDPVELRSRPHRWLIHGAGLVAVTGFLIFLDREHLLEARHVSIVEFGSLGATSVAVAVLNSRQIRTPLMELHLIALFVFAQASVAFLLAKPGDHLWWFAHVVFAAGFLMLGYAILRAYQTTRSFRTVYSEAELYENLRVRTWELEAANRLQAISDSALSHLSLDHLLDELLDRLSVLLDAETAAVLLLADDGRTLVTRASKGLDLGTAHGITIALGSRFSGRIANSRQALVAEQVSEDDLHPSLRQRGIRSLMGAPLIAEGRVLGVLQVGSTRRGKFSQDDTPFLQLAADRAALAIDRAGLFERERESRLEAETANRMKDEFLAVVSHELRTPLQAILGWTPMLLSGRLDAGATRRALEAIGRNAQAQAQLIGDILDVSGIITGKVALDIRPVDLIALIRAAIDGIRPAADAKHIRLEFNLDPTYARIAGDPDRLQQIVWNLLSNAVKFTPEEGKIEMSVRGDGRHVHVWVRDTGVGIRPEFLPHVFERFSQADASTTREYGGLGLGLAIVRHLVELHGGTVRADSEGEGYGATFTMTLPIASLDEGSSAPAEPEGPEYVVESEGLLVGLKLLVVEDDLDTRELLSEALMEAGAEVVTVGSAAEAIEAIENAQPDAMLADIGMPGEDGYSLIRRVRARPSARHLPAAALTSYVREEDRRRALAAGFDLHIPKPVNPAQVIRAVADLARNRADAVGAGQGD